MKFIRNKIFLKTVTVFFLITFLNTVFYPSISYALTAGPTSPDFSSFEPVDTTDMVNLVTGDFTYNIPLLEVPGPDGGYPLSLSYHAGIQPSEDASWAGLGWTLNAGAVNRIVNGYADDQSAAIRSVHDFWQGGKTQAYSVGVGTYNGVYMNLAFSQDTYSGFGVGFHLKYGAVGYNFSTNNGGGSSFTYDLGASMGYGAFSAGIGYTLSTDKNGGEAYGRVGLSVLQADLGSDNLKSSLSLAGLNINTVNNSAGRVSVESKSYTIPIPTPFFYLTLGYKYQRYWTDETQNLTTFGILNTPNSYLYYNSSNPNFSYAVALDSYSLIDPTQNTGLTTQRTDYQLGGSFPSYDNYNVSGQGVGGSIQPYIFENMYLHRQGTNEDNGDNDVTYNSTNQKYTGQKISFRFKNDFSNSFLIDVPSYPTYNSVNDQLGLVPDETRTFDPNGFNSTNNHLAGSRNVEWFTNFEIKSGVAKNNHNFVTYESDPGLREISKFSYNVGDQIGGMMITNSNGITYHYSLPVYAYDEYYRIDKEDELTPLFKESSNLQPYAYTWLLTAVTGPDYVDRGNAGITEDDYGYWVKFEYGKWTDDFKWRNPESGKHRDLDQSFAYYSRGRKEVYYLDAIKTRSHTALFVKDIRSDAKGVTDFETGGFNPNMYYQFADPYYNYPTSSLKLDKVYLFNNDELNPVLQSAINSISINNLKGNGNAYNQTYTYGTGTNIKTVTIPHYGHNVLDVTDIANINDFTKKTLKVITFNTDYTICPSTDNSLSNTNIYKKDPSTSNTKQGKLTLKSIEIAGKGGVRIMPSIKFDYGYGTTPDDQTKNPLFNKEKRDIWGMYKSDYQDLGDDNLSRFVSDVSAGKVDAWSLKQIISPDGATINIEYESDEYNNAVLQVENSLTIKSLTTLTGDDIKVEINESINIPGMSALQVGKQVKLLGLLKHKGFANSTTGCINNSVAYTVYHVWKQIDYVNTVKAIGSNYVVIENAQLKNGLAETLGTVYMDCATGFLGQTGTSYNFPDEPVFIGGNIVFEKGDLLKGGGLRVKSISTEIASDKYVTNYEYINGTTSYEPLNINKTVLAEISQTLAPILLRAQNDALDIFKTKLLGSFSKIILNARELPPPGVLYEKVRVRESVVNKLNGNAVQQLPTYQEFDFYVYKNGASNKTIETHNTSSGTMYGTVVIKDYTSRIGNLLKTSTYDGSGNILEEVKNTFLEDPSINADNNAYEGDLSSRFNNQGRIDQLFHEYRKIKKQRDPIFVYSKKEEYPSVLIKQEKKNYKPTGLVQSIENLAFDFYSGVPVKTIQKDAYGNYFITKSIPAYEHYPSMGLKIKSTGYLNKNMLTQSCMSYTYKVVDYSNHSPVGLVNANIMTWSDQVQVMGVGIQNNIWRPKASFEWEGDPATLQEDGLLSYTSFNTDLTSFLAGSDPALNDNWIKNSEATLYDSYSHVLESVNINNNKSSVLYDPQLIRNMATVFPASNEEIGYSGAEFYTTGILVEGRVSKGDGIKSSDFAHTGKFSLRLDPGQKGFTLILDKNKINNTKKYRASVWVYMPGFSEDELNNAILYSKVGTSITTQNPVLLKKAGEFYLINLIVQPDGINNVEIGCENLSSSLRSIYFDDFRVTPIDATMNSYVFDSRTGELSAVLNNDNFYIRYEYDENGRLLNTFQEILNYTEKRVNNIKYNYKRKD